jgi:DNA-binding NarL/FixJ family response regulator
MKKLTILLADDHTVVRQGLRALLAAEQDFEIVGEAENGREAIALAKRTRPDVVLMDVAMPMLNGAEATRRILENSPGTRIIVLTSYGNDECVAQLLRAGASGYLIKQTATNELPRAIREIRRGNNFYGSAIAKRLRELEPMASAHDGHCRKPNELTARELEVLQLVAGGRSNKEAALELGISIKTIEKHRQQVMNKLNIHEVAGLTRYALAKGIVPATTQPLLQAADKSKSSFL